MSERRTDSSPRVEVPSAGADRPSWTRVGVIAAVGFVVGVAWPRLAGVRLGPSLPETAQAPAASGSALSHGGATPSMPAASLASAGGTLSGSAGAVPSAGAATSGTVAAGPASASGSASALDHAGPRTATISRGNVISCQGPDGERMKGADCGPLLGLDALVRPRLRKLTDCSGPGGAAGKLHLTVRVDFENGVGAELGHVQGTEAPEAYLACAKKALAGAPIAGLAHAQRRYSVAYVVTLAGDPVSGPTLSREAGALGGSDLASGGASSLGGSGAGDGAQAGRESQAAGVPANGSSAKVEWDVAIVRDAPKTGKVIARLPRGTNLTVGGARDGWYDIKYGADLASGGWVYRAAIGR